MARENQGLQAALIIFVILTVILGGTTFYFSREQSEAAAKAKAADTAASDARTGENILKGDLKKAKEWIGYPEETMEQLEARFNRDMENYAGAYEEKDRHYSLALARMAGTIVDTNAQLKTATDKLATVETDLRGREAAVKPQIARFETEKQAAVADLTTRTAAFTTNVRNLTDEKEKAQNKITSVRTDAQEAQARLEEDVKARDEEIIKLVGIIKTRSVELDEIRNETFTVPDGEITWVDQRTHKVWINLGQADSLSRQISFSVYRADTTDLSGGKKADIQVTRIIGDHMAEARMVDYEISDPIMPGDKIYTPVWSAGEQKRFALAGLIDVDGDGKSDLETVISLIQMNGGKVDAWLDEDGKPHGKITHAIRHLVLGTAPEANLNAPPNRPQDPNIASYSWMTNQAKQLGIQSIPLADLLQQMGWKPRRDVVTFGPGSNPEDFKPKPAGGVTRTSTGNVSGLFQPRNPPRRSSGRGGAY